MNSEHPSTSRETFAFAHAYIEISRTDGTFFEIGVNLKPAFGVEDVEDALEDCRTHREVLACLLHYVQDGPAQGETPMPHHIEQAPLSDDEIADSLRLLRDALGDTEPDA